MINTITFGGLQDIRDNGMDWVNAKYKLYLCDDTKLTNARSTAVGETTANVTADGYADITMNTNSGAAHGLSVGDVISLSKILVNPKPVALSTAYAIGDFVTSVDTTYQAWFRCVKAGTTNATSYPDFVSGNYLDVDYAAGAGGVNTPIFLPMGSKRHSPNTMWMHRIKAVTSSSFTFYGFDPARFGTKQNFLGQFFPQSKLYLSDWIQNDVTAILTTSDTLEQTVVNGNTMLDAEDKILNLGALNSYYTYLLLVKTANSKTDVDLPLAQQKVMGFWDSVGGIGVYTPNFTGQGLYAINNFVQF